MSAPRQWLLVALRAAEFRSVMAEHEMGLAARAHEAASHEERQAGETAQGWLSDWQEQRRSAHFATDRAYEQITGHAERVHGEKQALSEAREADLDAATEQLKGHHARQRALEGFAHHAAVREAREERVRQLAAETEAWMLGRLNVGKTCERT